MERSLLSIPAPLPAGVERGICLAHSYQDRGARGYGSETSAATLRELVALGITHISLTPFGFMRPGVPEISPAEAAPGGEHDTRLLREIRAAHGLGLRVVLKPHVWIAGGGYRGDLRFDDAVWDRFLESYRAFILHYADIAAREDVDTFVMGVEFRSTVAARPAAFGALIDAIRARYRGTLTYAANWDEAAEFPHWGALDAIGVQFYPPQAGDGTEAGRVRALAAALDTLVALAERHDKPLVLTEVGYRAVSDPLSAPHAWPERDRGAPEADPRAQAEAYARLFSAVASRPRIRGIYWWKWFTDPASNEEGASGFSPRGREAELMLRAAYRRPD